jgi:hypothetical protein
LRVRAASGKMWWYDREALARVTPREATDDANTAASQLPACNPLVRGACPGVVGRIFEHGRQLWEQEPVWEAELLVNLKGVGEGDARGGDLMEEDAPEKHLCVSLVEAGCAFPRCLATIRNHGEVMVNLTAPLAIGDKVRLRRGAVARGLVQPGPENLVGVPVADRARASSSALVAGDKVRIKRSVKSPQVCVCVLVCVCARVRACVRVRACAHIICANV